MEAHYIAFTHANEPEHELLRVYPAELRRQYVPMATEETKTFGKYEVNVMKMEYSTSDCIVRLGCCKGVPVLIDAVLVILKTLHPLEDIEATFQPANVKLGGSCIADVSDVNEWKKLVYFFFPNILTTNSMTSLNFPHVSCQRIIAEH